MCEVPSMKGGPLWWLHRVNYGKDPSDLAYSCPCYSEMKAYTFSEGVDFWLFLCNFNKMWVFPTILGDMVNGKMIILIILGVW